ncbi:MAG: AAA family ATPase [Terrimonas sp.]|nr:AAA family ATPase [Terrimonas sp.]
MPEHDAENKWFELAAGLVNNSNRHVFLTGKAGTGKTTFLKYIQRHTYKKTAVVAPTGVAAINAGGVTMHSFFQLPFGPYVPGSSGWNNSVTDSNTLFKHIRFNQAKRDLLRELELLIIDEVSMVRADMLDAVDAICRHFRRQPYTPFGGLQVLYIGDLFQLPPVVNDEEWKNILSLHYKSPFFFDAQVIREAEPLVVELKKIYRQDEEEFISVLNNIRNNAAREEDLDLLHEHFDRSFEPAYGESYILLTTHNNKADAINQQRLEQLKGRVYGFPAEIKGEFSEKAFPADKELQLKEGAQVMFIKNDKGEARRYYNGKLAMVSRIDEEGIYVTTEDSPDELLVEQETWKNIRYAYDREKDRIDEEELGTFRQYPLRLAWAITIHKSQGLTFEKAIIDAGASFAAGQVYVALSRLTSLKGLVLYSRIHPNAIHTDERVLRFVQNEMPEEELESLLAAEQKKFVGHTLVSFFDWQKIIDHFQSHLETYAENGIPEKEQALEWATAFYNSLLEQGAIADKFIRQLGEILSANKIDYAHLHQRIIAAVKYFLEAVKKLLHALQDHTEAYRIRKRTKKYITELDAIQLLIKRKEFQLQQSTTLAAALSNNNDTGQLLNLIESQQNKSAVITDELSKKTTAKRQKGESQRISLEMFKSGNDVQAIARERGYAVSTIEGHLASFIPTGEVSIQDLLPDEKIKKITAVIESLGDNLNSSKEVKDQLPDEYSFADIRAVMLHLKNETKS